MGYGPAPGTQNKKALYRTCANMGRSTNTSSMPKPYDSDNHTFELIRSIQHAFEAYMEEYVAKHKRNCHSDLSDDQCLLNIKASRNRRPEEF